MSSTSGSATTPPASNDTIVRSKGNSRTGLYAVIAVVVVIVIILGAGYAAGWFKSSSSGTSSTGCTLPASTTVDGAGSTLVAPLMIAWSLAYTASTVDYSAVGSGTGITDITSKTVDYGASDAPLNPAQRAAIPSPGVLTIPESAGAAVPIYNLPGVAGHVNFNGQVLAEIYMQKITMWNDPQIAAINSGVTLPAQSIIPVHRSDGSGTTFVWSSFLSAANATWASTLGHATTINWPSGELAEKGNSGVTTTVQETPYSIGYVDINYALTNGVAYGAVQNPMGNYIVANVTNIESAITDSKPVFPAATGDWYNFSVLNAQGAHDYPIATFTYVFVYSDLGKAYSSYTQGKAENLVDFLSWIVGPTGQSYAAPLYYIPLSSSAVTFDTAAIHSLTFDGAAIPVCVPT